MCSLCAVGVARRAVNHGSVWRSASVNGPAPCAPLDVGITTKDNVEFVLSLRLNLYLSLNQSLELIIMSHILGYRFFRSSLFMLSY